MRLILAGVVALGLLFAVPALPQHGTIDGNETLFTVLAAINVAGYDADLDSPSNNPLRAEIRRQLAAQNLPSVAKLKTFFEQHAQSTPKAELSQYISFALLVTGPPEFRFRPLTYELPPDAARLEGLGPLLERFYREANIHAWYEKAQPEFEKIIVRYHEPVMRAVFEINGYLRNPTSGVSGRSFQVILSLLGAPNQVHTRSYKGDYYIVITPSPELWIDEIRYTYLHYVLEPIVSRAAAKLEEKKALGDYALGAPYLPEYYKHDFLLLTTASLIKAIEARLARVSPGDRAVMVDKAWRAGYILAPYFYGQLPVYEKQEKAMRLYFPEMVDNISLAREEARAQNLEFDQEKPVEKVVKKPSPPVEKETKAQADLERARQLYRDHQMDEAREAYLAVLREAESKPLKAKAYYGLARIAALRNDPDLAVSLFKKTLESSPEDREKAWALTYLGRLSDIAGEPEEAASYYKAALAVEGASDAARSMARKGASGAFRRAREP